MYRGVVKVVLIALPVFVLLGLFLMGLTRWRETAKYVNSSSMRFLMLFQSNR